MTVGVLNLREAVKNEIKTTLQKEDRMDDIKIRVIDSNKLIEAINTGSYDINLSAVMALGAVVTQSASQWIPTSERLPDNDRAVLVTLKWAEDDYEVAVGEYWHNSTASHGWGSFEGHVIAWHELPTPYREGGQDETD